MANIAVRTAISDLMLGPRAAQILEAHFDHPNMNQGELAKMMGISQSRVSFVLRHPRVRKAFPGIAKHKITGLLAKATERYAKLMQQDDNLQVSLKATEGILKNEKVIDNTQTFVHKNQFELMRPEELSELINRAKAIEIPATDVEIVSSSDDVQDAQ